VTKRNLAGNTMLKTEAETLLCQQALKRTEARDLISIKTAILWQVKDLPGGKGKGTPQGLFPIYIHSSAEKQSSEEDHQEHLSNPLYSADQAQSGGQSKDPLNPSPGAALRDPLTLPKQDMKKLTMEDLSHIPIDHEAIRQAEEDMEKKAPSAKGPKKDQ